MFAFACAGATAGPSGIHLLKSVTIGGDTFWYGVFFDGANHHVLLTHGTHVVVVDRETYEVSADTCQPSLARAPWISIRRRIASSA